MKKLLYILFLLVVVSCDSEPVKSYDIVHRINVYEHNYLEVVFIGECDGTAGVVRIDDKHFVEIDVKASEYEFKKNLEIRQANPTIEELENGIYEGNIYTCYDENELMYSVSLIYHRGHGNVVYMVKYGDEEVLLLANNRIK